MKILITGGCGFIGSAVCRYLSQDEKNTVVNLDALTYAAEPKSLSSLERKQNYIFVHGNISDSQLVLKLLKKFEITSVLHLAAESHVDRSIGSPEVFLQTNIIGTYSMLRAANQYLLDEPKNRKEFRFLHISTDEVFGDLAEEDPAFTEDTAYKPSSPYSASKAASDHLVNAWGKTYQLPTLITNCSNNYGPYQFPEKLIPLMIIKAISNEKLPVYGDGKNIRDWLHVEDHVSGLIHVLKHGIPGEAYNIGGNCERRNIEVVETVCRTLDEIKPRKDGESYLDQIAHVNDRPGHDRRYAVNCKKIENELGWQPKYNFEKGLKDTIKWYLSNEDWWTPLLKRNTK